MSSTADAETSGVTPTPTSPLPPPTIESLQATIAKQKETMKTWKESVKAQLLEAQTKNRAMRDERDSLKAQLAEVELSVRGRINDEYKERFAAKDEEITRLSEQLQAARQQRQADADEHLKILEKQKEQFQKEAHMVAADANATFNNEMAALEKQIKEAQQEAEAMRHELSVQVAKTAAVEARLREVSASAADKAAAEGSAEKVTIERLSKELNIVRQELMAAKADVESGKRRIIEMQEAHAVHLSQRIQEESRQRDDQLNVLQVLLRQSQTDVGVYQQRIVALQGALDEERDARESKLSTLRHDLLNRLAVIEEMTQQNDVLKGQVASLQSTVELLEEEKEVRERAFAEIFLSDDQKQMIKFLEEQLSDSQNRAMEAADGKAALEKELREAKEANTAILAQAEASKASLNEQRAEINEKMAKLAAQEKRAREQCEQLAIQADRLRVAMGGAAAMSAKSGGAARGGSSSSFFREGGVGGGSTSSSSGVAAAAAAPHASVPILEVDEFGKLRSASADGGGISIDASTTTLTANIDAFIKELRAKHHWADVASNVVSAVDTNIRRIGGHVTGGGVRYQQLSTYQQYRRLLPIIAAICFFSTFFYYWLFSSTSVKAGQTMRAAEVQETVVLVKQQYNNLVGKYNVCCGMGEKLMPMDSAASAGWKTK